jgi:hypothetical protein
MDAKLETHIFTSLGTVGYVALHPIVNRKLRPDLFRHPYQDSNAFNVAAKGGELLRTIRGYGYFLYTADVAGIDGDVIVAAVSDRRLVERIGETTGLDVVSLRELASGEDPFTAPPPVEPTKPKPAQEDAGPPAWQRAGEAHLKALRERDAEVVKGRQDAQAERYRRAMQQQAEGG